MKRLLILTLAFLACSSKPAQEGPAFTKLPYQVVNIPQYFQLLANHYQNQLLQKDSAEYTYLCTTYLLAPNDSVNKKNVALLYLLHNFFTSQSAEDGSRGPIVNIPYFWHWISPNPRHEIKHQSSGKLLKDIKPFIEFKNYKSMADLDRTPALFLKELFSETPLYTHPLSPDFSTFGWCSEREMAFSSLMRIYGYKTKVVAQGNHSWSVHIIPMKKSDGKTLLMEVRTDNTFDVVSWDIARYKNSQVWEQETGNLKDAAKWYNEKVDSETEQSQIQKFIIPEKSFSQLDSALQYFLLNK